MMSGPGYLNRRPRDRRALAGGMALVALVALVAGALGYAAWDRDRPPGVALREYQVGARPVAPGISGETLHGDRLNLADLRGDVVVVNVWASWCTYCRAETDDLEAVYRATRDQGVSFVGVNIRDSRDKAISFLEGRVSYPSIFDPASATALAFTDPPAPAGPPATLVVDRAGNLAVAIYRVVGRAELETIVTRVASEEWAGG
jgi:thiol-disulfide isomerase/thioredoxin